ncbi:uncharacterized protein LOC143882028 [Tasmannia lanceolata]|uniref:uncharacterized protein LOC143882028 n=1 Tax=Tasmannia lanceolata TaxID=3420 RepID=UPI004062FFF8
MAVDLCLSGSPPPLVLNRPSSLFNKSPSIVTLQRSFPPDSTPFSRKETSSVISRKVFTRIPRGSDSSSSEVKDDPNTSSEPKKVPFGYTRKDVLLIGLGVTVLGIGLESGLEFAGVNPLQAGNVVQLVMVLGLTVGWISTYVFRVSNKDMTYAQQLRDYEDKVMQKRLEGLTEAELQVLLEQVEEEKQRLASREQVQ